MSATPLTSAPLGATCLNATPLMKTTIGGAS